jgi:N,N'-diacetyllegionaminate synthase
METILNINNNIVGNEYPVFCVAEIGLNHNGDMAIARDTIDAAKLSGANAVKFQSYRTSDFIANRSLTYKYVSQERNIVESQWEMFDRCELSLEQLHELADYCRSVGITFHATPTSADGVNDLVEVGCPVLKNGSDFLTHLDLIAAMGESGLPTVLSTGMAELAEVEQAVAAFRSTGNEQLILLHCTSCYPAPISELNLLRICTLRNSFKCLVGFSDHSQGTLASSIAVALGACWIEKHFTLDKQLPGPDHQFSADPMEMRALVAAVRSTETALGVAEIAPSPGELESRTDFRLSCVSARTLEVGHVLSDSDVVFRRPGTGFPPSLVSNLLARTLRNPIQDGHIFEDLDFQ